MLAEIKKTLNLSKKSYNQLLAIYQERFVMTHIGSTALDGYVRLFGDLHTIKKETKHLTLDSMTKIISSDQMQNEA